MVNKQKADMLEEAGKQVVTSHEFDLQSEYLHG